MKKICNLINIKDKYNKNINQNSKKYNITNSLLDIIK